MLLLSQPRILEAAASGSLGLRGQLGVDDSEGQGLKRAHLVLFLKSSNSWLLWLRDIVGRGFCASSKYQSTLDSTKTARELLILGGSFTHYFIWQYRRNGFRVPVFLEPISNALLVKALVPDPLIPKLLVPVS